MAESLSFKPWDTAAPSPPPLLKDTLARVAAERGHFRDITESALIAEIEAPSCPSASSADDDDDVSSETSVDNEGGPPKTVAELYTAKNEMLANIAAAQQEIALALDFVSLLATANVPQAATTVSPMLKNQGIPMGSLGLDFWHNMPKDKPREDEEERLAKAVRFSQLRESADDLLAAAERLEGNVRRETVFWEQILGISERGWRVSRIPRAQGLLGVHFGFNGAAREFADRDLAALVAGEDGGIVLERGVGTKPKAVRVVVRREGRIVGSSPLPLGVFDEGEMGLEAKIRAARDSLFDEELQHELIREARGLMAMGVNIKKNGISFPAEDTRSIELELLSLDEEHSIPDDSLHGADDLAQAILLAARLLLSQAHRDTLTQKSQPPPPMSEKKDSEKPPLPILRPILRLLNHHSEVSALNKYLHNIDTLLGHADIDTTTYPANLFLHIPSSSDDFDTAKLISSLLQPLRSSATLAIPAATEENTMRLNFFIETAPQTETYTLTYDGKVYTLSTLQDAVEAADEFISAELVGRLHSAAPVKGAVWELDRREGRLSRVSRTEEEKREVFACQVSGEEGKMTLEKEGGESVTWDLKGHEQGKSLWDAWNGIIGEE